MLPDFDCRTCDAKLKKHRGCTTKSKTSFSIDGKVFWECPLRPYYQNPSFYEQVFESYGWMSKRNLLPEPGGWRDQSTLLIEYWKTVEVALADADREQAEREKARAKQQAAAAQTGPKEGPVRRGRRGR